MKRKTFVTGGYLRKVKRKTSHLFIFVRNISEILKETWAVKIIQQTLKGKRHAYNLERFHLQILPNVFAVSSNSTNSLFF